MRVTRHIVGWFTVGHGLMRDGEDPGRPVRLPVPAYLIEHAGERILVDTGPGPHRSVGPFEIEAGDPLPGGVTRIVLTHLHFDHAGGLASVPDVPVHLQHDEWAATQDPDAVARNFFLPEDYEAAADRVVLADGDADLLGDGAVRLLLTPGHTPGHQSVLVGDALLIGGDVAPFATAYDDHRFPIFGDDLNAQRASAERLAALRDEGVEVLPGHDPEVIRPGQLVSTRPSSALRGTGPQ